MTRKTRYTTRPLHHNIGSVSSGTMRPEDLIPSFLWELRDEMFRLKITLGDEAMMYTRDLADALIKVANRLGDIPSRERCAYNIRDENGNTVGEWEYRPARVKGERK